MIRHKYLQLLQPWVNSAKKYLYRFPDHRELVFYGSGTNTWGVQTNQKALAAFAVLAEDPDLNEKEIGMTREELLEYALAMLRFSLRSHMEGDVCCTDGTSWGHTWISVLGIERMMHGVRAIWRHLTEEDKILLKKVLTSEADWLLDHYPVEAGPVKQNKPESNLWNGAFLHRTAAMYPDLPRAAEYREKGSCFLVNSISVPSDAESDEILDGKPVSGRYAGNNFFSSYALNHHHYMNVGYMVICLSNVAMLHFFYREKGIRPPEALYHHVPELWQLVRTCIFPDGRLLRIGGDTRVRYCYCQDYLIPVLLLLEDRYKDPDCWDFEQAWLNIVKQEQEYNRDGSFLSRRVEKLACVSPLYYSRLESDKAATLAMGLYWHRMKEEHRLHDTMEDTGKQRTVKVASEMHPLSFWTDDYHGASLHRSDRRIASWVWEASEKPQGLCLPPDKSDMAEWHQNLAGEVRGMGCFHRNIITSHEEHPFDGGFLTYGKLRTRSERFVAEGEGDREIAVEKIIYAALPDDATVLVMQQARALNRDYFRSVKGLLLQIPNDLFNGNKRTYYMERGKLTVEGYGSKEEQKDLFDWVNIDNCLSVLKCYGDASLSLYRPGTRQIQITDRFPDTGNLYADEICCTCRRDLHPVGKGNLLFDVGSLLRTGENHVEAEESVGIQKQLVVSIVSNPGRESTDIKGILCQGVDKRIYLLLADMGDVNSETTVSQVQKAQQARELCICMPEKFSGITDVLSGKRYTRSTGGNFHCFLRNEGAALFTVD